MVADRGPATATVTIIFVVLASVFVGARVFTRTYLLRSFKRDDWWIVAAWLVAVGFSIAICTGVHYGLGKHKEDITDEAFVGLRKSQYAFSILYNPALMLTKNSITIFYLSVMSRDVDPVFKWCTWLTMAVVNIAGLALTFANIFQCNPVSVGYQYPTPDNAVCIDIVTLYQSSAPVNIITDLAILILPITILTKIRLPRKQKLILLVTFGFGVFVAIVDVIRLAYLQAAALDRLQLAQTSGGTRIVETNDFPWYASLSFMWSAVEVNLGIICACVPSLKPLFARFLPSFISDVGDTTMGGGGVGGSSSSSYDEKGKSPELPQREMFGILNNPAAYHKPSCAEYIGDDDGDGMGFYNMLAGPPSDGQTNSSPTSATTLIRHSTNKTLVSDFGFVKMHLPRNMLELSNKQSIWPVAVVTGIFFLWGFAYGLLSTLNGQFATIAVLTSGQMIALHSAYFAGYFLGPLSLGRFVLRRYGFKASMMAGLCIYGCGTLVFWPAAVLTSYTAFVISNFIVGFGLSCLEIAANPYTALCGPLEYAEVRLNLSQGFQAIGTIVSPLLASKVLFRDVLNAPSLINTQWTYLGIAIFVWLLAIVFYYLPLPEATDAQLERNAERRGPIHHRQIGRWRVVWVTLALGVFAQWCYVGAQEGVGSTTGDIVTLFQADDGLVVFDYVTIAHTVFAAGRFLCALLNLVVKPRWLLLFLFAGLALTNGLQIALTGDAAIGILMTTYALEAGVFSIIFAMSMRGMGKYTKTASAFMTTAISAGGVVPVIQWAVWQTNTVPYSFSVLVAVFGAGIAFPLYLNLVPAAKLQVDPQYDDSAPRLFHRVVSPNSDHSTSTKPSWTTGIMARVRPSKSSTEAPALDHDAEPHKGDMNHSSNKKKDTATHARRSTTGRLPADVAKPGAALLRSPGRRHRASTSSTVSSDHTSSALSSSSSSTGQRSNSDSGPPTPPPPRAWTEKDDMIDDYHNALKGI